MQNNTLPIDIHSGIKQILDLIQNKGDKLSYSELSYYNIRLVREINRLYRIMFTFGMPVEYTKILNQKIERLEGAIGNLEILMSNKSLDNYSREKERANFSNLTNRLNNLML